MSEVKATRIDKDSPLAIAALPGNFRLRFKDGEAQPCGMTFGCPCGCGAIAGVTLKPADPTGWGFDGNLESPTVTPSIDINRGHWHGFLTNGVFKSC